MYLQHFGLTHAPLGKELIEPWDHGTLAHLAGAALWGPGAKSPCPSRPAAWQRALAVRSSTRRGDELREAFALDHGLEGHAHLDAAGQWRVRGAL